MPSTHSRLQKLSEEDTEVRLSANKIVYYLVLGYHNCI